MGNIKVCMLILQNVRSKNPQNLNEKTPLTVSRENDQFKVGYLRRFGTV